MKFPILEALIGGGLALLVFLAAQGVNLLPLVFFALLAVVMQQSGALRAAGVQRKFAATGPAPTMAPIRFDEIGGQASAKQELIEALDFMADRESLRRLGIRPLKGILLTGPPGTGKTLLARAAAHYTKSAFVASAGSEFIEVYAGVGAQRVRELFKRARELARQQERDSAIVFIDEMEVVAGRRGRHASHLEYDQTLNQLLVEMDGISDRDDVRVLVIGATNRADLIDPALLRPGRFDRTVQVALPDREGREAILRLHLRNKPLAPGVDLGEIARETFGFSGAHLENVTNEAAILALRCGREQIDRDCLLEAIDKVMLGEKLDRRPSPEEKRRVAVHEAGHALVSEALRAGSVASATITPRGGALGYVRQAPSEDRYLHTADSLRADIQVCLAGALAEEVVLGSRSTGALNDIEKAMEQAQRIIRAGLSASGIVDVELMGREQLHEAVRAILEEDERRVRELIERRRPALERLAAELERREAISGDEVRALLAEAA